jgi:hypothetical protein
LRIFLDKGGGVVFLKELAVPSKDQCFFIRLSLGDETLFD